MPAHEEAPGRDQRTEGTPYHENNTSVADCTESLSVARELIEAGIPVFVAKPATNANGSWNPGGGHNGCGYWFPRGWQRTEPNPSVLDDYRPGDALGLVDTDPRSGGDDSRAALDADGAMPRVYGVA